MRHVKPQVPVVQVETAFARAGHTLPQPPQLRVSVAVDDSQPLALAPSQSARPKRQVVAQVPAVHIAVDVEVPEHARPHDPQLPVEVRRSVSQPLAAMPSQLPQPDSHTKPQVPAVQVAITARAGTGHGVLVLA